MNKYSIHDAILDSLNGDMRQFFSTYSSATIIYQSPELSEPEELTLPVNYTKQDLKEFLSTCKDIPESDVYLYDTCLTTREGDELEFKEAIHALDDSVSFQKVYTNKVVTHNIQS